MIDKELDIFDMNPSETKLMRFIARVGTNFWLKIGGNGKFFSR